MRRSVLSTALCALVICLAAAGPVMGQQEQGIEGLRDRVKEHVLPNGMKFLLLERHASPTVSFHVYFDVGSVDEQVGETGIAHLYEHMAFKGTKDIGTTNYAEESKYFPIVDRLQAELAAERDKGEKADKAKISQLIAEINKNEEESEKYVIPNELGKLFEKNGGNGLNAQTERDQTHYYINLPANKIELWMAIESDRMKNEVLRQLYKERDVVMEEVRRTIDTNPIVKLILQEEITTAFHAHPYGLHSGIGWTSDVSNLTRPEVDRFFHKYYGGANCTVAIVGDFDSAKIISMIDRYFSSVPAGEKNSRIVTVEPPQEGERRVKLEAEVQPALVIGYHRGDVMSKDAIIYDVISQLLSNGRTSRFYKNLVEGKRVATDVSSNPNPPLTTGKYPSLFEIIGFPLVPGHSTVDLEKAIYEELDKLKTEPVSKMELQKIINQVDADFVRSMESNETMAESLAFTQGLEGDWRRLTTYRQRLAQVTPEDVMRVSRELFKESNRTVGFIAPMEAAAPEPTQAPAAATPESLARGKAIIEAGRAVLGDAAASVKDYSIKADATLYMQGQQVKSELVFYNVYPDKMREELELPGGQKIVQVLNGDTGWILRGDKSIDAPPPAVKDLRDSMDRNTLEFFLRMPDNVEVKAQALPDQQFEGKPMDVVLVTGARGVETTLLFDKTSHRLLKAEWMTTSRTTGQPAKAEETYDDFKQFSGIWLPTHTRLWVDGQQSNELILTEYKINSGITADTFRK